MKAPIPPDRLPQRLLAALLAAADRRAEPTMVAELAGPGDGGATDAITLVALPDRRSAVALIERGAGDREELTKRLERLLARQAQGILFVVLVGGTIADRPALLAADRGAPDPNKLGVYHLDAGGTLDRVAGRRLKLLDRAGETLGETEPIDPATLKVRNDRARQIQEEGAAFGTTLAARPTWATRLLGAACIVYFGMDLIWERLAPAGLRDPQTGQVFGADEIGGLVKLQMGANSAPLVAQGQIWRLLSHAFLHGGALHIGVNLVALFSFGGFIEGLIGWRRYIVLYVLSAIGGGLASALLGHNDLSVGASGAIWGLLGAGLGLVLRRRGLMPPTVMARLRPRLLGMLVLNVGFSTMSGVDFYAHGGGGLVGFALAGSGLLTLGLPTWQQSAATGSKTQESNSWWVHAASAVALVLIAAAIAAALAQGHPWRADPSLLYLPGA